MFKGHLTKDRRTRWVWLRLIAMLVLPAAAPFDEGKAGSDAPPAQPNVLILIGDDHVGGSLGIDGDPHKATPNLDRLVEQGVRFDRAVCNSPVCTPSRQSFITGRLPHAVGVTVLTTKLPDSAVTLGDWVSDHGYATAAVGKMHFNGPSKHGFAYRIDKPDWRKWLEDHPPEGGDQRRPWRPFRDPAAVWLNAEALNYGLPEVSMEAHFFADHAAEFLRSRQGKNQPFALVVGFNEPHSPFVFPREWQGRFQPDAFSVPPVSDFDRRDQPLIFKDLTPAQKQGIQAAYYTSVNYLDHELGRVLDALDASGLAENTIVVYLGDHGYLLGQHGRFEKHILYEPGLRVPLIFRWPKHLPEGRRVTEQVELVDLLPTLLDLCGLPNPPNIHGQSLTPLLNGEPGAKGRDIVFSEYLENEEAMVRSDRYKLIVGTGRRARQDGYETANPTPGPYKRLYDLQADPDETTNLHDQPDLASTLAKLQHALYTRLVTTREGRAQVPPNLSEIEAIHWCLVPRDAKHKAKPNAAKAKALNPRSE
ncbi:MAG: sulfatase-like hydrolase/transferase [Isosphaeraceae bacterium]